MADMPPPTEFNLTATTEELGHLLYVLTDLAAMSSALPNPVLTQLWQRYDMRYRFLYSQLVMHGGMASTQPTPAVAALPQPMTTAPAMGLPMTPSSEMAPPALAVPSTPWNAREFVRDHAIVLISYMGALALIASAALFEIYTAGQLGGGLRFAAVAALEVGFGVAGGACLRHSQLRIVGRSYLFIFALLAPLSALAAYRFLDLSAAGITPGDWVAVGGIYSAVVLGGLSLALGSRPYAVMAQASLTAAALGAFNEHVTNISLGVVVLAVVLGFCAIDLSRLVPPPHRSVYHDATLFSELLGIAAGILVVAVEWAGNTGPVAAPGVAMLLTAMILGARAATDHDGRRGWTAHASLLLAAPATILGEGYSAASLALSFTVAGVLDTGALLLITRRTWRPGLLTFMAVGLLMGALLAPTTAERWALIAVLASIGCGLLVSLRLQDGRVLHLGTAALLLELLSWTLQDGSSFPLHQPWIAITLVALAVAGLVASLRWLSTAAETAAVAAGAALLFGCALDSLNATWYMAALVLCSAALAMAGEALPRRAETVRLYWLGAAVALSALFIPDVRAAAAAALLALVAAVTVRIAVRLQRPEVLAIAAFDTTLAWYWGAQLLPRPSTVTTGTLGLVMGPLPILLMLISLGMRRALGTAPGRTWGRPLEAAAGVVAVFAAFCAVNDADWSLLGWLLVADSLAVYAMLQIDRLWRALPAVAAGLALGVLSLCTAVNATDAADVVACSGVAGLLWATSFQQGGSDLADRFAAMHRGCSMLLLGTVVSVALLLVVGGTASSPTDLAALLAGVALAALVAAESVLRQHRGLLYWAAIVAGGSWVFVAAAAQAGNADAYVIVPALTVAVTGVMARDDTALRLDTALARLIIGGAVGAILLTATCQMLGTPDGSTYAALLFGEGIASVLAGIGSRDRTMASLGAAGVVGAMLWALGTVLQTVPLYAVFGIAALLLLGGAALLATLRHGGETSTPLRDSWAQWR